MSNRDQVLKHAVQIQRVEEGIFLGLQVTGGHILLPLIIATSFLSKATPRHTIFLNFCFSWTLSSIIFSLLLYTERSDAQEASLTPGANMCLIQAALVNGIQAMSGIAHSRIVFHLTILGYRTSSTTLALVIHIWSVFRQARRNGALSESLIRPSLRNAVFLTLPSLIFAVFAIITLMVGDVPVEDNKGNTIPNLAVPTAFYCIILQKDGTLKLLQAVYVFTVTLAFITFFFEGLTMFEIYRRKTALQKFTPKGLTAVFIRLAIFSVLRTLILGFNLIIAIQPQRIFQAGLSKTFVFNGFVDLLQASLPLAAGLILGTQKDFLDAWFFCKRRRPSKRVDVVQVDVAQEKSYQMDDEKFIDIK
ncbi:hypothetical protein BD410DRAFT_844363 [Rickenella mellea]|uniref:Uncharacterized protein n=1 Tax=Rickenella mellea TaxID=50990 RepID=A0A4Y7PPQ4_9AGAM|nr:hypothetical protein BD410DRAFT_844363 [Rickenella mellea]